LEISENKSLKIIEVWLTKEESIRINREELTAKLLSDKSSKYKVVFLLSGRSDLLDCTKGLLICNVRM